MHNVVLWECCDEFQKSTTLRCLVNKFQFLIVRSHVIKNQLRTPSMQLQVYENWKLNFIARKKSNRQTDCWSKTKKLPLNNTTQKIPKFNILRLTFPTVIMIPARQPSILKIIVSSMDFWAVITCWLRELSQMFNTLSLTTTLCMSHFPALSHRLDDSSSLPQFFHFWAADNSTTTADSLTSKVVRARYRMTSSVGFMSTLAFS